MTPAQVVVECFMGVRATARVLQVNASTVCRWLKPKHMGGTGGMVPAQYHQTLIVEAAKMRRLLTEQHLRIGKPGIEVRIIRRF